MSKTRIPARWRKKYTKLWEARLKEIYSNMRPINGSKV